MKSFTTAAVTAVLLATGAGAPAVPITEIYGPNVVNTAIADNDPVLTTFLHRITGSAIVSLTEVQVSFELRGTTDGAGWASDLFASLIKSPVGVDPSMSDPSAVLLNRVGIGSGDPVGFGYDGWSITLKDGAAGDIHDHFLVSGVLTGTFQPDGRAGDPALDPSRTALLGAFNGGLGNGDWRLNVGDLAEVGTMQLMSWSLTLTGDDGAVSVPEGSTWVEGVGALAGLCGAFSWRSRRRHLRCS